MKHLMGILGVLLVLTTAQAQELPLELSGSLPGAGLDLGPYTAFYEDGSVDNLPLPTIRTRHFRPFAQKRNERATFSNRSVRVTWLRFTIRNNHPTDTLRLFHETGVHNRITTYENGRLISQVGMAIFVGAGAKHNRRHFRYETLLTILPGKVHVYHVQVMDYVISITPIISKATSRQASLELNYAAVVGLHPQLTWMSLLIGCLLFMSLYALYSFLLTRDRAFLYYLLYSLSSALIIFHTIDRRFGFGWLFPHYPTIHPSYPGWLHPALLTIFYGLFIIRVLGIRLRPMRKHGPLLALGAVLVLQQGLSVVESFQGRPIFEDNFWYRYGIVPAGLFTLVLLGRVIRSRSPIRGYVLTGMLGLLIFTLVPVLIRFKVVDLPFLADFLGTSITFWMQVGLSVEALCFAMALAYRARLTELENRRMQESYARDLETQLEERSRQIQEQSRLLEAQHIRQIELDFEQRLAGTEMTALRAQMNPHFLFNCLNSIKLYATENEADKAAEYLTKFSRLMRLVLENSRSERVSLKNEVAALRLYLEMEAMRFKDKLSFGIFVEPGIDSEFIEIPPLLIQPYVENAIWHGLMHKEEGGSVNVRVEQPQDARLLVTVTDDGIGRTKASELKSRSAMSQKSFGMKVTSERIALINQLYSHHTHVQIFDLTDAQGQPAGTEVVLDIPV